MKIIIADYNPLWPVTFLKERHIIESALNGLHPVIEHIGSTSVPGLGAKPIIDILVGLENETQLEDSIPPMINMGYVYFKKYNPVMPYRRYFVRLNPAKGRVIPDVIDAQHDIVGGADFTALTNVHVIVKDTYHFKRHIALRDYLKAHPDVRDEYDALKRGLSQVEFKDGLAYNDAKDSFVKQTERDAVSWVERTHAN
jgi:GrpB-like predicted nucleotidyltransferase (UPF0157 family)